MDMHQNAEYYSRQIDYADELNDKLSAQIVDLEAQLAHKDKVIEILGKRFEDMCGTCPADLENWEHPNGCGNECDTRKDRNLICWKQWADEQAKEAE